MKELEAVQEAGAKFGQGYLLARPAFPPPGITWPTSVGRPAAKPSVLRAAMTTGGHRKRT